MRKHNFVFIDIETTGLNLIKNEIIEIGCVLTTPKLEVIEEFELKIKPEHIENADPVALKINHYNSMDWKSSISLKEAMNILCEKAKDCIMVGHNVSFDAGFLEHAFNQNKIANTMHYHKLDTISIAWAKLHNDSNLEHFSLREMCVHFGIKNERAHSALPDARRSGFGAFHRDLDIFRYIPPLRATLLPLHGRGDADARAGGGDRPRLRCRRDRRPSGSPAAEAQA